MKALLSAFGFLTVIPMPHVQMERGDLGRAAAFFPLAGVVIGLFVFAVYVGALLVFPASVCAVITLIAWAWITGGLHLDGVADCGDGFFAAVSRERRLEIMRDPRMGAFGGIGLMLFLFLKLAALAEAHGIPRGFSLAGALPLLYAPVVARYTLLLVAKQPPARPGGLGDEFAQHLDFRAFVVGLIFVVAIGLLDPKPLRSAIAFGAALVATGLVILVARRKLGGMTGDVLGLTVEIAEVAVLLVYCTNYFGY